MNTLIKHCAIYTRKSTEEGLEQDFNSLDAQQEACEAYITSQKGEGWKALKQQYSDGGYSGGNMNRPGLTRLLEDIKAGGIQVVVVYKIDRLTRSLMDFSKLVEIFDAHGVTFVSVTQSFNTTTSMGRLTLNVLLSFAQFEREVIGERVRDKVAASKAKGFWMGGFTPLGYERIDKKLIPQPDEAKTVRFLFEEYLKLKSVGCLRQKLDKLGIKTPVRISRRGNRHGYNPYCTNNLYRLLSNPVYIGKVRHIDKVYDGLHKGIIDPELYEKVQTMLAENNLGPKAPMNTVSCKTEALLQGKLVDPQGTLYSHSYIIKRKRRYCYYISQNYLKAREHPKDFFTRLPAYEIEKMVTRGLKNWLRDEKGLPALFPRSGEALAARLVSSPIPLNKSLIRSILTKAVLHTDLIELHIDVKKLKAAITAHTQIALGTSPRNSVYIKVPFLTKRSVSGAIIMEGKTPDLKDPLDLPAERLKRIVRGTIWREEHFSGSAMRIIAEREGFSEPYVNRCIIESLQLTA